MSVFELENIFLNRFSFINQWYTLKKAIFNPFACLLSFCFVKILNFFVNFSIFSFIFGICASLHFAALHFRFSHASEFGGADSPLFNFRGFRSKMIKQKSGKERKRRKKTKFARPTRAHAATHESSLWNVGFWNSRHEEIALSRLSCRLSGRHYINYYFRYEK